MRRVDKRRVWVVTLISSILIFLFLLKDKENIIFETLGNASFIVFVILSIISAMAIFGKAQNLTIIMFPVFVFSLCLLFSKTDTLHMAGGSFGFIIFNATRNFSDGVTYPSIFLLLSISMFTILKPLIKKGGNNNSDNQRQILENCEGQEIQAQRELTAATERISFEEDETRLLEIYEDDEEVVTKRGKNKDIPPVSILETYKESEDGSENLGEISGKLIFVLNSYDVQGKIVSARSGPVINFFELEPISGTRAQRILSLQDDIAISMKVDSVRIVAPVPGAGTIGFEIPRKRRIKVFIREIIESEEFRKSDLILPLALGKDLYGRPFTVDLAKLPHILIAGTTGSGKSVLMHSCILSTIFKASYKDLKLLLVDPKMLEFSPYRGIPNLICDVITDPRAAAEVLKWAVAEMIERYKIMSEAEVRDIDSYNEMAEEKIPRIVIFIDELSDLMVVASKKVEESVTRLSQLARAAGIHLVVATQRPSVDVITGIIKANFSTRISLRVASKVDSRVIIDSSGAETLLGQGDMLYVTMGARPVRVQGAFVSERDVKRVVKYLKSIGEPEYIEIVSPDSIGKSDEDVYIEGKDPKYQESVDLARRYGQISISMLQRKLKIGFNRAARIVEQMEEENLVRKDDKRFVWIG